MKPRYYWVAGALALPILVLAYIYHLDPILRQFGNITLFLIAVVVNTFVFVYAFRNWNANQYGRALMYTMASLASLTDLTLITIFLGPNWEYRNIVRLFLFGGIFIAHARMLQLLFRTKNNTPYDVEEDSELR